MAQYGAMLQILIRIYDGISDLCKGGVSMSQRWIKAALIRAIRTFCQSLIGGIGTGVIALHEVNWTYALSVAVVAAILSILTSLTGLPEVDQIEDSNIDEG